MHIHESVFAGTSHGQELLLIGAAAAAAGTAIGLYKLDYERIPKVAVLSAAFFVASLVQVPLGLTCEHLVLAGLMGLVLGWATFPAMLVALLLQAAFGFGGLTTLGLNTLIMALPAVVCYYLFRRGVRSRSETAVYAVGFAAGAVAILLAGLLNVTALVAASASFKPLAVLASGWHLAFAGIEGLVTGSVVVLLRKVRPELLDAPLLAPVRQETVHG
jgi:cobalt/nickel transport system permease protein